MLRYFPCYLGVSWINRLLLHHSLLALKCAERACQRQYVAQEAVLVIAFSQGPNGCHRVQQAANGR